MGRLFDGPWPIVMMMFGIGIAVVAGVVLLVLLLSGTGRQDAAYLARLRAGQLPVEEQAAYLQGVNHRSQAALFGVIGLFVLGVVFGPLALVQANRAEALGVAATAGKVLGWICVALAILGVIVFMAMLGRSLPS
ncbi:hypothetical protein [Arthrobacter sp. NPDC090010]|uniref:hypothetical protein n=1 Tax=Arthrobacter sp. NPDC090010 TaxID=3363942 RepID=UPI003812F03A